MRLQITQEEVNDALGFSLLSNVHKVCPGIVLAYRAAVAGKSPPKVDVQPAVNDVRIDPDTGAIYFVKWPILPSVRLAMPSGGGFAMNWALKKNDKVTLLSFDLDPTAHFATGQQKNPVDTGRHVGGYWVALPFDLTDLGAVADPGSDCVFQPPASGGFVFGPGASDAPALGSAVDGIFNGLANELTSAGSTPLTGTSLAALLALVWGGTPAAPATPPTTTASQLMKLKK